MALLKELENQMFKEIDNLSREEIKKIADKMDCLLEDNKTKYIAIKILDKALKKKATQLT